MADRWWTLRFGVYEVRYVTREQWGSRYGATVVAGQPIAIPDGLVGHHTVAAAPDYDRDGLTVGDFDDMARFMRYLQGEARPDLGPEVPYSWVTFNDTDPFVGWAFEGRGPQRSGAHTQGGANYTRYGVAFEGNTNDEAPTEGVITAYQYLRTLTNQTALTTGHRDWHATACPGHHLYARIVAGDIDRPLPTQETYDMPHVWMSTTTNETWLCNMDRHRVLADANGSPTGEEFAATAGIPIYRHPNAHYIISAMYPVRAV